MGTGPDMLASACTRKRRKDVMHCPSFMSRDVQGCCLQNFGIYLFAISRGYSFHLRGPPPQPESKIIPGLEIQISCAVCLRKALKTSSRKKLPSKQPDHNTVCHDNGIRDISTVEPPVQGLPHIFHHSSAVTDEGMDPQVPKQGHKDHSADNRNQNVGIAAYDGVSLECWSWRLLGRLCMVSSMSTHSCRSSEPWALRPIEL